MKSWDRLEMMARSVDLTGGLEARIADPLWLLSRQWQVAEFQGEDAAQPAAVRITGEHIRLNAFLGNSGEARLLPGLELLEPSVEQTPAPHFGAAGLHANARASWRLFHRLRAAGLATATSALRAAFPLELPDRLVQFGNSAVQAATLFTRLGIDAPAVARAEPQAIHQALAEVLNSDELSLAERIMREWLSWYNQHDGQTDCPAWEEAQLEYHFSVTTGGIPAAGNPDSPVHITLEAPEHDGGHLDWYSFDVASSEAGQGPIPRQDYTAVPAPVRYPGMPASRWWQFEDGSVNFGDLEAGPSDVFRLLVSEFAASYSNDWFILPVTVPVGTLTQISNFELMDNFGGREQIKSAAENDSKQNSARAWRLFELSGDEVAPGHAAPWLFAAPTLVGDLDGPVLERVSLIRDEGSNLVWGIEAQVEGVFGRSVDRAAAWHAAQASASSPPALAEEDQAWWYRLETPALPWWIPFLSERIQPDSTQIQFRRARMQGWEINSDPGVARQVGPQGMFLDPYRPLWVNEAAVQRSGIRLERRWHFGRLPDGSYRVWIQRRKIVGRGERSSGLRWDALLANKPAD